MEKKNEFPWFMFNPTYCFMILRFLLLYLSDHVLIGHVTNTSTVADEFECHQKCLGNNSCKSFNVHPSADIAKRLCELNNKTRKMMPENFKKMQGSSYYGPVKVSSND